MSYHAIVAPITEVLPHPNSDKGLLLVRIAGSQVITTTPYQVDDLTIFFPEGGALDDLFLFHNSEYRYSATLERTVKPNKDPNKSGLFEDTGRIRSIKLRGEISEGYISPLSSVAYTGVDISTLQAGTIFTELNNVPICKRYVSPAQAKREGTASPNAIKQRKQKIVMFKEHFDTENLKYHYTKIPTDARVLITEKLHGTSGRTGNILVATTISTEGYKRVLNLFAIVLDLIVKGQIAPSFRKLWEDSQKTISETYRTITGSRRVAFVEEKKDSYYIESTFRQRIHEQLEGKLHKGETVYYEIVGYQNPNSPLFHHTVKKDAVGTDLLKKFKNHLLGTTMEYSYGCNRELGECDIYVYRITQTNNDGYSVDLSYSQRLARCSLLGLKHVPRVFYGTIGELTRNGVLDLLNVCNELADRPSTLSDAHISEGICLEIEHPNMLKTFKNKSFNFRYLEGLIKDDETHIDLEEIS